MIGLACLPLLILALAFARFSSSQRILSGVSVGGVALGGLDAQQARKLLEERAAAIAKTPLRLALKGKEARVSAEELGLELRVLPGLTRAQGEGRSRGLLGNVWQFLCSFVSKSELNAETFVDRPRFEAMLAKVRPALVDAPPIFPSIVVEQGAPRAVPARAGQEIAVDSALHACQQALAKGATAAPIELESRLVTPSLPGGALERALEQARQVLRSKVVLESGGRRLELTPEELGNMLTSTLHGQELELGLDANALEAWLASRREAWEAPAKDAGFEVTPTDQVRVTPGEPGIQVVVGDVLPALWRASLSSEHRGELPLRREPLPARTTEQAEKLGIKGLVSTFTTAHPCCQPRVDNIHRIATLLDGWVVEPGQTGSVNAQVGPRSQKNGFVLAPSIEDGEMVDSVGGGVSQFATTLFNALFRAGYDIVERQPHSYWFPRYPMGLDATLGLPRPDIVFKNDSAAGLLIKTSFTDKTITVKLYGDVGGRRVTWNVGDRKDIVQPAVELLPNRGVEPDEEKVKEGGMIGWSVITSRTVTFGDGTKKEERRKVTYRPKPRRVEVHPCRIPKGEPGSTGEKCPEPEPEPEPAAAADAPPAQDN